MASFKNILQKLWENLRKFCKNYENSQLTFAENLRAIEDQFFKFIKLERKLAEN